MTRDAPPVALCPTRHLSFLQPIRLAESRGMWCGFNCADPFKVAQILSTPMETLPGLLISPCMGGDLGKGFHLNQPEEAEIILQVADGDRKWWPADSPPARAKCGGGFLGDGVAVNFTSKNFNGTIPASMDSPLTLQFGIPVEAGMINPLSRGKYSWSLITYCQSENNVSTYEKEFHSPVEEFGAGVRSSY